MPNNANAADNLTPFPVGASGNPSGRPRKFVTQLKAEGYKKSEIADTYAVMLTRTIDELNAIYRDQSATALERIVAGALFKDLKSKSLQNIELILGRAYGTPRQTVDGELGIIWHEVKTYGPDEDSDERD